MKNLIRKMEYLVKVSIIVLRNEGFVSFYKKSKYELIKLIKNSYGKKVGTDIKVEELLKERFINLDPILCVKTTLDSLRMNIVTDSVKKHSLFGGVATALILATLFANKHKITLRIITRTTENNPLDFEEFLKLMRIKKPNVVEYFSDYDRNFGNNNYKLEVSENDIFISTSWWTSEVVKKINLRKNFFYLLQEVETFFYPNGDDQYLCSTVLEDKDIFYILNSKLLYDYYSKTHFSNVAERGIFFEPAFEKHLYSPGEDSFVKKRKYKLFFYARPQNPRNLFYTGIKLLDTAISAGLVDMDEWEIYFAGSDIQPIKFSNGKRPIVLGNMTWKEYSEFLKTVDLGFSLMYTPHPSYPPLDIASSGGVVLTNRFLNKQNLHYSKNIICADLGTDSMLKGFEQAIALAKNSHQRKQNYDENNIENKWESTLEKTLAFINTKK